MTEPITPRGRSVLTLTWLLAAVVVALHGLSIAAPTGANWGFHFFAFLPPAAGIAGVALMALLLIPFCQEQLLRALELAQRRWAALPQTVRRLVALLGLLAAVLLFWLLRERTLLLGDGALVVRSLEESETPGALSGVYRTAPLPGLAAWGVARLVALFGPANPAELAWRILSILTGVGGFFLSGRIARELTSDPLTRLLVFLFIVTLGTTQFFFGYVETYPLAYLFALSFLAASLAWLRTGNGAVWTFLFFALMVLSHITLALFLPGLLLIIWKRRGNGVRQFLPGMILAGLIALLVLRVTGFTLAKLTALGDLPGSTRLPLFSTGEVDAPYPMVSVWHITDLLNFVILVAPFALPALFLISRRGIRNDVTLQFLLLLAAAGGIWLGVTHFTIGLSRDWDVAAVSSVGWMMLGAVLWARWGGSGREVMRLLAGLSVIAGIHTAAWVAVNADQGRSLKRFENLYTEHLWTAHAGTYAFEDLSAFSRSRRDFFPSMVYSAKALALDSTNPRRWLHFAGAAQLAGWDDRAIQAYERGLAGQQAEPGHFRDCARLYLRNDRIADAIRVLERARERFPADSATVAMLGELR